MRTPLITPIALASVALVAACAANEPPSSQTAASATRQCFLARNVNDFFGATNDSVMVRAGVSDVYWLGLSGNCTDIDWAQQIALRSTGGSSWICQGLDAEILVPSPIGTQRCLVTDIRKLSPEEAKIARAAKR